MTRRHLFRRTPAHCVLSAIVACTCASLAHGASFSWKSGVTGVWSNTANWTPAGTPGAADNVTVGSGSITLDINPTVSGFLWNGGTLSTGSLTVTSNTTFTGGSLILSAGNLTNSSTATGT